LVVARNVVDGVEVKFFLANVPPAPATGTLRLVGFSRGAMERCFADSKDQLGRDHFAGRSDVGLKRPQAVTAVSLRFLAWDRERLRGEKPGADGRPGAHGGRGFGAVVVVDRVGAGSADRGEGAAARAGAAAEYAGANQPHEADAAPAARRWRPAYGDHEVQIR
jgi:hypothetical protein